MRTLPFFIVKIAGNFRWFRKLRLSTENFGSWGSKFPDYMEQSFSPTQQDESCVIRAGWRNSAERLVTVCCRKLHENKCLLRQRNLEWEPVAIHLVFNIPMAQWIFFALLPITFLIVHSCTRWRGIFERLSQDLGLADFVTNFRISLFNESLLIDTTFSQIHLDGQCPKKTFFLTCSRLQ